MNTDIQGSALIRRGPSTFNIAAGTAATGSWRKATDDLTDRSTGALDRASPQAQQLFQQGSVRRRRAGRSSAGRTRPSISTLAGNRAASTCSRAIASRRRALAVHDDNLIQTLSRPGDRTRRRRVRGRSLEARSSSWRSPRAGSATTSTIISSTNGLLADDAIGERRLRAVRHARSATRRSAGSAGPARTCSASRSKPAPKPPTTRSTTRSICSSIDENGEQQSRSTCRSPTRRVNEKRGEIYVEPRQDALADASDRWWRELRILEAQGHAATRSPSGRLKFLKPNLTLDWKPGSGWHTQLSVRRTVAQLEFLRFHQRRRPLRATRHRQQCGPGAAARLGIPRRRSNIRCSATDCSSSTSATTSSACSRTRS